MGSIPIHIRREARYGTRQVEGILRVAGRVASRQHGIGLADVEVVLRDGQARGFDVVGRLDDGGGEAADNVELDVAVEQPDACMRSVFSWRGRESGGGGGLIWIVSAEANDGVGFGLKHDGVALQGGLGVVAVCAGKGTGVR